MSEKEALKQRITGHVSFRASLMTINMVLGGALAVLFVNVHTGREFIVFILGSLLETMFILLTIDMNKDLEKFYKKLEE